MAQQKPLEGVRIISMGQVVAGPMCTALLADLGADVIKVESPGGDSIRGTDRELNGETFSILYELYNRNKRSVCLDVKREGGREVFYDLIEDADVFVQNFGPGVAERLGIDEATLAEHNEDLIYVSISGYGETGPMAGRASFDTLVQHASGFASIQGYEDDEPHAARCHVADYFAGYNGLVSALAALYHRDVIDEDDVGGQKAEISMFESIAHNTNAYFELYNNVGELPDLPSRDEDREDVMYGAERTKDGWVAVAFLSTFPNIWQGFCELVGREDLLEDPDYATPADRAEDDTKVELNNMLRKWLLDHTTEEAVERLNEHGIPAEEHREIQDIPDLEHAQERNMFVELDHPAFGSVELTNTPLSLSETPPTVDSHSPLLGEHNEEVLGELGYSPEDLEALREDEVVAGDA